MRKLISTGSPFEKTAGYSRAVVQGDWCFVSGTTGYDDLRRDAVRMRVGSESIPVASLADIIRSKGAAGRDKDYRTLPLLRELLAERTQAEAESRRRKK